MQKTYVDLGHKLIHVRDANPYNSLSIRKCQKNNSIPLNRAAAPLSLSSNTIAYPDPLLPFSFAPLTFLSRVIDSRFFEIQVSFNLTTSLKFEYGIRE